MTMLSNCFIINVNNVNIIIIISIMSCLSVVLQKMFMELFKVPEETSNIVLFVILTLLVIDWVRKVLQSIR